MPRADLHVHSWHSTESGDLRFLKSRDCYSDPEAVYRTAKARGMDFVCITDHDSIGGGLELLEKGYDDVILAEEVSCRLPGSGIMKPSQLLRRQALENSMLTGINGTPVARASQMAPALTL